MRHNIGLYLRVSTDEQALRQEGSLDSQKHRLQAYVDIKNVQDASWGKVVDIYTDDGISAKDTNRPAFQRMMKDLRKGRINLILVTDLSRLSRNIKDFCVLLEDLKKSNAQFLSIKEQFDTTTAAGEMMVFNMINLAQFERKQTSERVSLNFHARAMRGLRNGGYIPLGYDRDPNDKSRMVPNEDEAKDVRTIFETYITEWSLSRAVAKLNQIGIRPKAKKHAAYRHVHNGRWAIHSLQVVLRNKVYIGLREVNLANKDKNPEHLKPFERYQIVKASWQAIVDEVVFHQVQKILDENQILNRARLDKSESRVFLASGFISCGECGRAMVGSTGHGAKQAHRYYTHRSIPGEPVQCAIKSVRADELESAILNQLDHVLFREGYLDDVEARIDQINRPKFELHREEVLRSQTELTQVQKQIQAAFRLHADMGPDVVDDLFREELLRLKTRKSALEARIHELEASGPTTTETADKARKTIEINLADFKRAKSGASQIILKRLMRRVIESIVLEPGRIALNYWTSNEERDERQTSKTKKASDYKSGANLIPFKNHQRTSSLTQTNENRDDVVFCSDIVGTGRAGGIRTHDLTHPKRTRYQLRYSPTISGIW